MRLWQIAITLLLLLPGILMLWRIPRCGARKARGRAANDASPLPRFSVIVPARNEEARLPALLASLAAQTVKPVQIIIVDDESTDATAELARGAGCTVVRAGPRPEGWLGKPWACWRGASEASEAVLLFLDADTVLAPEGCALLLAEWRRRGGVVSVQPWHRIGSPIEALSLYFNIVVMAAFGCFTILGPRLRPAGCFGPCILCAREDYDRIGGHASVRGSVIEDVEIGRLFMQAGVAVRCFGGRGTIAFRMYPEGYSTIVEGWTKNMARGANRTAPAALALPLLWVAGCVATLFFLVVFAVVGPASALIEAAGLYALCCLLVFWLGRKVGKFGPIPAVLYPVGMAFFIGIVFRSAIFRASGRAASWKGRAVGG